MKHRVVLAKERFHLSFTELDSTILRLRIQSGITLNVGSGGKSITLLFRTDRPASQEVSWTLIFTCRLVRSVGRQISELARHPVPVAKPKSYCMTNPDVHAEGPIARTLEQQTAKLPSDLFLWAGSRFDNCISCSQSGRQEARFYVCRTMGADFSASGDLQ